MHTEAGANMFAKANFGHTDSAVTAGTDSPAQLLTVAQIDYDISSSLIFLLIHSGSARPFKLFPQSQEKPQRAMSCLTGLRNENSFFGFKAEHVDQRKQKIKSKFLLRVDAFRFKQ